jgi:hypothetical protein
VVRLTAAQLQALAQAGALIAAGVLFNRLVDPDRLGAAGEEAVPGEQNTDRIPSESGAVEYRVPDRLTEVTIEEIKNVLRLSKTKQLMDYLAYARATNRTFVLWVRGGAGATRLSTPLQELIREGLIRREFIPR